MMQLSHLDSIEALSGEAEANDVSGAFNELTGLMIIRAGVIVDALGKIAQSAMRINAATDQFGFGQDTARYYAAKASGQPFAKAGDMMLDLPVNQAINSQDFRLAPTLCGPKPGKSSWKGWRFVDRLMEVVQQATRRDCMGMFR